MYVMMRVLAISISSDGGPESTSHLAPFPSVEALLLIAGCCLGRLPLFDRWYKRTLVLFALVYLVHGV